MKWKGRRFFQNGLQLATVHNIDLLACFATLGTKTFQLQKENVKYIIYRLGIIM
jgi:hypothetical protein